MKLYVGNLPWSIGDQELEDLFSDYSVVSAKVIKDRNTDRSRGFGFVELESGGEEAIEALNESEVEGRQLKVNEAKPK
ncbi:MAG: RNA-binding protein [Gammaproteobacteria bacterium]|jgi:RNA recognition motif-containing protein|nr:RNA-binding protein [Gammaproteobacteria bacterium]|tara:strand:- start:84 stop:317 length:234 start_codon:yes stop_codon:yes gene_type:complete